MLNVARALEDSRYFKLGCRNLVIATYHKPLVRILNDRALDDTPNPRLFRLKPRTLMWNYRVVHVPGKAIPAAHATLRYPAQADVTEEKTDKISALSVLRTRDANDWTMERDVIATVKIGPPNMEQLPGSGSSRRRPQTTTCER